MSQKKVCYDIGGQSGGIHIECKKGGCHDQKHSGEGKAFIGIPQTGHGIYYHAPGSNGKGGCKK